MARVVADDTKAIEQRATGLLARREHSAVELQRKLQHKGFASDAIAQVIDVLQQRGWQSDERYAQSLFRQRVEAGYGPLKIRADLAAAGVATSLIEQILTEQAVDWKQCAARRFYRRFGEEAATEPRERARRQRYLFSRGFLAEHFPPDI